jgi:hypothetical protein
LKSYVQEFNENDKEWLEEFAKENPTKV